MQTEVKIYPPSIAAALHAVMSQCGYVQKKGKNKFQDYKYAGEGHLLESLRPAMVEAGILLIPSGKSRSPIDEHGITHVEVEYTLLHKDGSVWPDKIVSYGDGGDKNSKGVGDKGLYKALTGANKYLLFKMFQIETGDDPEKETESDKDAPPANDSAPPVKNAPGVTKAREWVNQHLRHLHGAENGVDLMIRIAEEVSYWDRIRTTYPNVWIGPEQSGLHGETRKIAITYQCVDEFDSFIMSLEHPKQEAAE